MISVRRARYGQNYVAEQEDMALMLLRNEALQKVKFTVVDLRHLRRPA